MVLRKEKTASNNTPDRSNPATDRSHGKASKSIASTERSLSHQLEILESTILKKMNELLIAFEDRISTKIDAVVQSINTRLLNCERELNLVKESNANLCEQLRDVQRTNRLSDVIIRGIPYVPNENSSKIIMNVATRINHQISPYFEAFRLKPKCNSPIVVRLSCIAEQKAFLSAFRRVKGVKLSQLDGFSSTSSIYANESLTPYNNSILREALKLRREETIFGVRTKNGFVFIKRGPDDLEVRVNSVADLQPLSS